MQAIEVLNNKNIIDISIDNIVKSIKNVVEDNFGGPKC